jgi:hypothetical protein
MWSHRESYPEFYLRLTTGDNPESDKLYISLAYNVGGFTSRKVPYKQNPREFETTESLFDPVILNSTNLEEKLVSLIGKSKADVCVALGISEDNLWRYSDGDNNQLYEYPVLAEYCGVDFVVFLTFTSSEGQLRGVELLREYEEVTEQYARDIVNVVQAQKGVAGSIPSEEWQAHTVDESRFAMFLVKTLEDSYNEGYVWYLNTPADEKSSESDEVYYGGLTCKHYVTWYRDADEDVIQLRVGWLVD